METIVPVMNRRVKTRQKLWTRDQYEKAVNAGIFTPEEKIELIEGELIQKMPQNTPHFTATGLMEDALAPWITAGKHHIRIQMPMALGLLSEPEPDIAVVEGARRDYARSHPQTALLLIEVAASSLDYDRTVKAAMYAKAGISDYWIVNLNERVIEVYREPVKVNGRGRYQIQLRVAEGEAVTLLYFENAAIAVADVMP